MIEQRPDADKGVTCSTQEGLRGGTGRLSEIKGRN